jgi:hypothetical protein
MNRGTRGVGFGKSSNTSQELPRASRLSRRDKTAYRKKYSAMTSEQETMHRNSHADLSGWDEVFALWVR